MDAGACGPDVALGRMERDLRGLVEGRTNKAAVLVCEGGARDGDAKIGEHKIRVDVVAVAQEDVGRFHVAVDNGSELRHILG